MRIESCSSKPSSARKSRTKTRKPKFLSLQEQLSPDSGRLKHMAHPQLTLFPLHPENLFEEKELHDNVAYLLDGQQDPSRGAALNGLLGGGGGGGGGADAAAASGEDSGSPSQELTYAYGAQDSSQGASTLAQAALRRQHHREREEKWVLYSDVVESKEEEISSRSSSSSGGHRHRHRDLGGCYRAQGLSLKLDYEQILSAWSDKGSLFIEQQQQSGGGGGGECPQTVPDQAHDGSVDVGCIGDEKLWNVPEEEGSSVIDDGTEGKIGPREARVMRYKEKRQSRLFSKRIRYQVRKLNAEKRPRMKGRFVKRKPEA